MSKFGRFLGGAAALPGKAEKVIIGGLATPLAKGTAFAGKRMVRDTEPGIANLWTGKRESVWGVAAAAGIGTAYGIGSYHKQTTFAPRTGQVSYGGTAPIMNADGVSSTTQAPTLGANGNMVFGLHSARKG